MKAFRVSLMACMFLYFAASCIAFGAAAIYISPRIFSSGTVISAQRPLLLFCITELGMAILFGLAAFSTMMGWQTRNKWGIAGSLLSICVPLLVLYWGVSVFWHYLLACLWPSWLFGGMGLILYQKASTPHSLSYDFKMVLRRPHAQRNAMSSPASHE